MQKTMSQTTETAYITMKYFLALVNERDRYAKLNTCLKSNLHRYLVQMDTQKEYNPSKMNKDEIIQAMMKLEKSAGPVDELAAMLVKRGVDVELLKHCFSMSDIADE